MEFYIISWRKGCYLLAQKWNFFYFFFICFAINGKIPIFAVLNKRKELKSTELHRRFVKAGYKFHHAEGSHYFYIKNGVLTEPVPYHGAKEMYQPLADKLIRKYGV